MIKKIIFILIITFMKSYNHSTMSSIANHAQTPFVFAALFAGLERITFPDDFPLGDYFGVSERIKQHTLQVNEYIKKNVVEKIISKHISIKDLRDYIFKKVDEKKEYIMKTFKKKIEIEIANQKEDLSEFSDNISEIAEDYIGNRTGNIVKKIINKTGENLDGYIDGY